ncbi:hypothetical protein BGZ76_007628 [Entomortierella beljakovae]|nr:hypothetical protein BGZ76_007628 [Entomortierella beljakovae]
MASTLRNASLKRIDIPNESQSNVTPSSKRIKKSKQERVVADQDHEVQQKEAQETAIDMDISLDVPAEYLEAESTYPDDLDDVNSDIDVQDNDRESSGDDTDEDEVDQELRENNSTSLKKEIHTSDRVQKVMTNPEIEAAFHDRYMTQITQAFGDELNALRETDSLEGPHLELLIDSLNQTGHIYSAVEKPLWITEDRE